MWIPIKIARSVTHVKWPVAPTHADLFGLHGLRKHLVDGAAPHEGVLRCVVVGAGQQRLAGAYRLREGRDLTGAAGERRRYGKRLREETPHLARPRYEREF